MAIVTIDLTGHLRAADAAALRTDLLAALAQGDLVIDTRSVSALDCAVVQVLLAARQTAAQHDRILRVSAPENGAVASFLDRIALPRACVTEA
jgi:anti-anti-sigma regulatory factor